MRVHEPAPRVAQNQQQRTQPATPIDRILALQRGAGNRAVARFLDVTPVDWLPDATEGKTAHIDIAILTRELTGSDFERVLEKDEKQKLQTVNSADLRAKDIPTLATGVIAWLAKPKRIAALTAQRRSLEDALARAATVRGQKLGPKEEQTFLRVLERFVVASRAKEVPNEVELGQLEPAMRDAVLATHAQVKARNVKLGDVSTYVQKASWTPAEHATHELTSIRSAHQNRAGWLRPQVVPPALDADASAWATAESTGDGLVARELREAFGDPPNGVTAQGIEDGGLDAAVLRRYYRDVVGANTVTARTRAQHAWRQYANPQWPGCPYIEFTASDAGGLSRYVWDYNLDRWYIGVHYNWCHGYNPFIFVRGMPATF